MTPRPLLVLIGYRGTGKTSVAQHVALALGWDWVDADVEIELRAGKSIREIFADEGEPAFRDLESLVLSVLLRRRQTVLATGGGAVLRSENREMLAHVARTGQAYRVWLTASVETILARLEADAATRERRPALTNAAPADEVRKLLAEREPWYRECADLTVDTNDRSLSDVAQAIVRGLGLEGRA